MGQLTFREAFCRYYGCPLEKFEQKLLWKTLYPQALPLAWIMYVVNRDFFQEDFRLLRHFGNATSPSEVVSDAQGLRFDYRNPSKFLRMGLKLRLSGKRIIRVAGMVFARTRESQAAQPDNGSSA